MIKVDLKKDLHSELGAMKLDIQHEFPESETTAICGHSGAGKSTLLRMIAGISQPTQGLIQTSKHLFYSDKFKINIAPEKRSIGFLFQELALFPNMTVEQNIKFALKNKNDTLLMNELLEIFEIEKIKKKYPIEISGGQKQRTALARTLSTQAPLLLLDEPFSALDPTLRKKLQNYLYGQQKKRNLTIFLISHNYDEIKYLAKNAIILEEGRIIAKGRPEEILNSFFK